MRTMIICNLRFFLYVSLIICFCVRCTGSNPIKKYESVAVLKKYMKDNHEIDVDSLKDGIILFIIPVNGCSDCVDLSLSFVENYIDANNILFVLLADRNKDLLKATYSYKLDMSNLLIDNKGKHNNYDLGLLGPSVFKLSNGEITFYESLHRSNFEDTFKKLGFNYSP